MLWTTGDSQSSRLYTLNRFTWKERGNLRSRNANTTAQPSIVLVVPAAASDPQLRKFGFVGASDSTLNSKKGQARPEGCACPL